MFLTRIPLTFYRPIPHGADRLNTAPPLPHRQPPLPPGIAIGTLNIQDFRGFRMVQAIRALGRGGFDVTILAETKISMADYCRNRLGYEVTCSTAWPSSAEGDKGGIWLVTKERPVGWGIESTFYHGMNEVSCKLVTGITWTPLVGVYLNPSTLEHLTYL